MAEPNRTNLPVATPVAARSENIWSKFIFQLLRILTNQGAVIWDLRNTNTAVTADVLPGVVTAVLVQDDLTEDDIVITDIAIQVPRTVFAEGGSTISDVTTACMGDQKEPPGTHAAEVFGF